MAESIFDNSGSFSAEENSREYNLADHKVYVSEKGKIIFKNENEIIKKILGFIPSDVSVTDDGRMFITSEDGEKYVLGNNENGQIAERKTEEIYRRNNIPFSYSWDPFFEHPEWIYEQDADGNRRITRRWDENDTAEYLKKEYFKREFYSDAETYMAYMSACNTYGERNVYVEIEFDVDFNTPSYRNGDYYRQDFEGFSAVVISRTNSFIYEAVKADGSTAMSESTETDKSSKMSVSERFLKYVSFGTDSDESSETCPSTQGQLILGKYLAGELREIGLTEVEIDENGYVYGIIEATEGRENDPSIGFIAHMDTAPAVSGSGIKPQVVSYRGGDIKLNEDVSIRVKDFPYLEKYIGCDIITTDGTTLLGSDDKAGIAEIFTACEYLVTHPEISHGRIAVGITPDEEIGRGADRFDVKRFACDWAYTVDGGELGEIEYENFNAASAKIKIHGINIHPGSAKNKMKNASLLAAEFINMMPATETPAHTEGYEGFYHLCGMEGDESSAELEYIIRDHSAECFAERKEFMKKLTAYLNSVYGEGTFEADIRDSYYNMKEKILPYMHIIDNAERAMRASGVEPLIVPIRGGTDGARLSFEGLPCPNLSTGGANFHGVHEFIPVQSMEKMVDILIELMKNQ